MKCVNCGSELRPGAKFCTACGKKVESAETPLQKTQMPNNAKHKLCANKKAILAVVLSLAVLGGAGVCLNYFLQTRSDSQTLKGVYSDYASEYEVTSENSDGTYEVQIEAPDVGAIADEILSQSTGEITVGEFRDYLKRNEDDVKVYTFSVDALSEDEIRKKFFDKIAYDLAIVAIQNSNYEEGDGLTQ